MGRVSAAKKGEEKIDHLGTQQNFVCHQKFLIQCCVIENGKVMKKISNEIKRM